MARYRNKDETDLVWNRTRRRITRDLDTKIQDFREELLNEVWGYNAMPSTRTVDVHVAWLRQKLEDNPRHPQYILTVHGLGYKFVG